MSYWKITVGMSFVAAALVSLLFGIVYFHEYPMEYYDLDDGLPDVPYILRVCGFPFAVIFLTGISSLLVAGVIEWLGRPRTALSPEEEAKISNNAGSGPSSEKESTSEP